MLQCCKADVQSSTPDAAEIVQDIICIVIELTNHDITVLFLYTEYCGSVGP